MKRKKILVVIGGSYVSGLEIVTLHMMNGLKKSGHEVRCVVSGWNDGVFIGKLKELEIPYDEVKLGWIYISKPLWTIDTLLHLAAGLMAYRRILKSFDPDICHFCGYSAVVMLSQLIKKRHCVYNLQEPHAPTRKHLFIYRLLNKRITIFTAVSNHIVKVLLELGIPAEKIRLIYNGVPAMPDTPANRENMDPVIFGIIGQVVPWKGHETLIDAVEMLAQQYPGKFLVYIFGNEKSEYAVTLKQKIKIKQLDNYFSWKGFVTDQDGIYAQVDIVLVPSLSQEPCSLTILESMMRGKTIIASDRGGNTELIDDGENGFIFKAGDAALLAATAGTVLNNKKLIRDTGLNSHRKALEKYTDTRMTAEYDKVYASILETLGDFFIKTRN